MINLREQTELDLYESMEREWKMPVEIIFADGKKQTHSLNNPSELLGGQVLYFSRSENPVTGEPIVVNTPVISLRISSLIKIPEPGEKCFIRCPISPKKDAPWVSFVFTTDKAPEDGTDIGFIRIYPQKIDESEVPSS